MAWPCHVWALIRWDGVVLWVVEVFVFNEGVGAVFVYYGT